MSEIHKITGIDGSYVRIDLTHRFSQGMLPAINGFWIGGTITASVGGFSADVDTQFTSGELRLFLGGLDLFLTGRSRTFDFTALEGCLSVQVSEDDSELPLIAIAIYSKNPSGPSLRFKLSCEHLDLRKFHIEMARSLARFTELMNWQ